MRTPFAALVAVAIVCSLAGCATRSAGVAGTGPSGLPTSGSVGSAPGPALPSTRGPAAPAPHAADARGLVGWWQVRTAGAGSGMTLVVGGRTMALTDPARARSATFAWAADGADVLVARITLGLTGAPDSSWLTGAERLRAEGSGWDLLDAGGHVLARLEPAARSRPQGTSAPETSDPLAPITPGPGVSGTTALALAGTWSLKGHPEAAITFTDGRWRVTTTCRTGATGGSGVDRLLDGGRLLVVRTASRLFGCPITRDDARVPAPALVGFDRAASLRIDGDTLTLFDRSGALIGSLVRR